MKEVEYKFIIKVPLYWKISPVQKNIANTYIFITLLTTYLFAKPCIALAIQSMSTFSNLKMQLLA